MNPWTLVALAAAGLLTFLAEWVRQGQAQATGAALRAGQTSAATAKAEAAIAQAEVDAPATRPAILDRLKAGSF